MKGHLASSLVAILVSNPCVEEIEKMLSNATMPRSGGQPHHFGRVPRVAGRVFKKKLATLPAVPMLQTLKT